MASLDYLSPPPPRQRPWPILIALALLLLTALVLTIIPVRQVESRMDTVTGSITWKTVWLYCITSGPHVDVSPLETRLKNRGIPWTPSSQFLHNTHRNIFGSATCYECGRTPPIYHLRPLLDQFTAVSTDTELREFVRIMQSGTHAEQKVAVDAASEKALSALETSPPTR